MTPQVMVPIYPRLSSAALRPVCLTRARGTSWRGGCLLASKAAASPMVGARKRGKCVAQEGSMCLGGRSLRQPLPSPWGAALKILHARGMEPPRSPARLLCLLSVGQRAWFSATRRPPMLLSRTTATFFASGPIESPAWMAPAPSLPVASSTRNPPPSDETRRAEHQQPWCSLLSGVGRESGHRQQLAEQAASSQCIWHGSDIYGGGKGGVAFLPSPRSAAPGHVTA